MTKTTPHYYLKYDILSQENPQLTRLTLYDNKIHFIHGEAFDGVQKWVLLLKQRVTFASSGLLQFLCVCVTVWWGGVMELKEKWPLLHNLWSCFIDSEYFPFFSVCSLKLSLLVSFLLMIINEAFQRDDVGKVFLWNTSTAHHQSSLYKWNFQQNKLTPTRNCIFDISAYDSMCNCQLFLPFCIYISAYHIAKPSLYFQGSPAAESLPQSFDRHPSSCTSGELLVSSIWLWQILRQHESKFQKECMN